jgi:diguanylate cyclase (GGDEF)-like protein
MKPFDVYFTNHIGSKGNNIALMLRDAVIIGVIVFLASILGIITRPVGHLASFWPANPLLLGILLRRPHLVNWPTMIMVSIGFVSADFIFDNDIGKLLWLCLANLVSVLTSYMLLMHLDNEDRHLLRPRSMLYLFVGCSISAFCTAIFAQQTRWIFVETTFNIDWRGWFSSELANSMAILPMVLAAPSLKWPLQRPTLSINVQMLAPILLLLLSLIAGMIIGGPGAIAFPIPALLWCAIRSDVFVTTILTWLTSAWMMVSIGLGWLDLSVASSLSEVLISTRIGVALMSMAPIAVACNTVASNAMMRRLHASATRDMLTNALTRREFLQQGHNLINDLAVSKRPVAVMMCDIDHFKRINDTYGHATGDKVLSMFAQYVRSALRDTDLFGRLGGEEFAVILPGILPDNAMTIAELIRVAFAQAWVEEDIPATTVSIGLVTAQQITTSLDTLLLEADKALYQAKNQGRNCVHMWDMASVAQSAS